MCVLVIKMFISVYLMFLKPIQLLIANPVMNIPAAYGTLYTKTSAPSLLYKFP